MKHALAEVILSLGQEAEIHLTIRCLVEKTWCHYPQSTSAETLRRLPLENLLLEDLSPVIWTPKTFMVTAIISNILGASPKLHGSKESNKPEF